MKFVAIDVETANANMASICQIGLAHYEGGVLVDEFSSLVNPEDYFSAMNVRIHGISEDKVSNAPTLPAIVDELLSRLNGSICVSHTNFDQISLQRAFDKYQLVLPDLIPLDSAKVARRTWQENWEGGYGLANVCKNIGFDFQHHDALEDAKASGHIILTALKESGESLEYWLDRVRRPVSAEAGESIAREGNPDGELSDEVLVFTGALSMPRREAAKIAAEAGCTIASSVTKKTTLVVVGDQDISRLAGKDKSSKHLKAEQLIEKGLPIRIMGETDFQAIISKSS